MNNQTADLVLLADELESLIQSAVPAAQTLTKYGGTLYTLKPDEKEGQFCGVFIYTKHVQIVFSKGAMLDDPAKVLTGSGKIKRHVNFSTLGDVDQSTLTTLLIAAAAL